MESLVERAVTDALNSELTFCKFLSANDTGETGGHQAGIYIPKNSIQLIFDEPGIKGINKERWAKTVWPDGYISNNRFIYYGKGTRNEYRITNFGKGFPYLKPAYTGALFVLVKRSQDLYAGYVFNTDDEIELFLDTFGLSPADTNRLIETGTISTELLSSTLEQMESREIENFISKLAVEFPTSKEMASAARKIQDTVWDHVEYIKTNPDKKLVDWTNTEFKLFKALETARYEATIQNGFSTVNEFVDFANSVLNKRKSRAGKSLEHQLEAIFDGNNIKYTSQGITEGKKKPDFIFPSQEAYQNPDFPTDKLAVLAAKTTCKDRWRQMINEANRLRDRPKFLFTLQQAISGNQLDEMLDENVILVVPQEYIGTYPKGRDNQIWSLKKFVDYIVSLENIG